MDNLREKIRNLDLSPSEDEKEVLDHFREICDALSKKVFPDGSNKFVLSLDYDDYCIVPEKETIFQHILLKFKMSCGRIYPVNVYAEYATTTHALCESIEEIDTYIMAALDNPVFMQMLKDFMPLKEEAGS